MLEFKDYSLGSVLTKDIVLEVLQSPKDLYHRQGFFLFLLDESIGLRAWILYFDVVDMPL